MSDYISTRLKAGAVKFAVQTLVKWHEQKEEKGFFASASSFSLPAITLDRAVQFCLEMDVLSLMLLPLHPALKWFFKGFDKAAAKVLVSL